MSKLELFLGRGVIFGVTRGSHLIRMREMGGKWEGRLIVIVIKGGVPLRHHFIPLSAVQWQVEKSGKEAPVYLSMNEMEAIIMQDPGMHLLVYCHPTQTTISKFVQGCGSSRDVVPKNPALHQNSERC